MKNVVLWINLRNVILLQNTFDVYENNKKNSILTLNFGMRQRS